MPNFSRHGGCKPPPQQERAYLPNSFPPSALTAHQIRIMMFP